MARQAHTSMIVSFLRAGNRRYAVRASLRDGRILEMDPAPGFDPWMPHDLQHFLVEKHLGIAGAVFGRLAAGGTAGTFHAVAQGSSPRDASRLRRRHAAKDARLMPELGEDYARSERATYVCWQDWLQHADDPALQARGAEMAQAARSLLNGMSSAERAIYTPARCAAIRQEFARLSERWVALAVGESLSEPW
ncbi:hypothetical protein LQG66_07070 [Bradyrhizobium ontarionense]|uniref:Uncharacterized protein n=1 Tax=Bradyrhizobium ontarionense TaxID=2898149 RepID=A0ABY3RGF9_9BRAD|nr:hypothetical protein [Bradyrhizobium sp. A19]UFZ06060.1 hypothetical protein LQG66_07070 [Bradyrhizobium sp. A19]